MLFEELSDKVAVSACCPWSAMPVLHLPDCTNARDLAGLPLSAGRTVPAGALLRSDNHDRLTLAGIQAVRDLGVSRILDVRYEWETRAFPSPFADDPIYVNRPLDGDRPDFDPAAPNDYRPLVDEYPGLVAAAFIALAEAPAGPVLVHCHGGRDRTGILVALALAVAGASARDIVADYALTDGTDPEAMQVLLTHLDDRHGGVTAYLANAGVGEDHLEAMMTRLAGSPN